MKFATKSLKEFQRNHRRYNITKNLKKFLKSLPLKLLKASLGDFPKEFPEGVFKEYGKTILKYFSKKCLRHFQMNYRTIFQRQRQRNFPRNGSLSKGIAGETVGGIPNSII